MAILISTPKSGAEQGRGHSIVTLWRICPWYADFMMQKILKSFGYAFAGIRLAWEEGYNFRIGIVCALLTLGAGAYLLFRRLGSLSLSSRSLWYLRPKYSTRRLKSCAISSSRRMIRISER